MAKDRIELTDEELDKLLEKESPEENKEEKEEQDDKEETTSKEDSKETDSEEDSKEETVEEDTEEDDGEEAKEPLDKQPEAKKEEAPATDEKEKADLIKRIKDKDDFIKRQNQELDELSKLTAEDLRQMLKEKNKIVGQASRNIGQKRREVAETKLEEIKRLAAETEASDDDFNDNFHADPKKYVSEIVKKNAEIESRKAQAQQEYESALQSEMLLETKEYINDLEPEFEDKYVTEIIEIVKDDVKTGRVKGELSPQMIEAFKANPYTAGHEWLSKMIRRVDKINVERSMSRQNTTKEDLIDKIEKVANNKPSINGKTKQSTVTKGKSVFNKSKADEYSDEEIEEALKGLEEE